MEHWSLIEVETPGGALSPVVLATLDGARAITIRLQAGQELGEHEVRERAWLVVVEGAVEVSDAGPTLAAPAGSLVTFAPGERHTVRSPTGARLLLLLAPWPGDGHYVEGEARARAVAVPSSTPG